MEEHLHAACTGPARPPVGEGAALLPPFVPLEPARFEGMVEGEAVRLITLRDAGSGFQVAICTLGARVLQMGVPTPGGPLLDVALGHESLAQLRTGLPSVGAFIGRFPNRIGGASFVLDGVRFALGVNDGPHCLHGGVRGSRFRVFRVESCSAREVVLSLAFADGEEGFPGALALRLRYSLEGLALRLDYEAVCTLRPTVAGFTSHIFFNLNGQHAHDVAGHWFRLPADRFFPLGPDRIPHGGPLPLAGRGLDLRQWRTLRDVRASGDPQLWMAAPMGVDHAYLQPDGGAPFRLQAEALGDQTGLGLEVWSTEPVLQFYAGGGLDGSLPRHAGKQGVVYQPLGGFCLEPQPYPNAPNRPDFPSVVLAPGETLQGRIEYRLGFRS